MSPPPAFEGHLLASARAASRAVRSSAVNMLSTGMSRSRFGGIAQLAQFAVHLGDGSVETRSASR